MSKAVEEKFQAAVMERNKILKKIKKVKKDSNKKKTRTPLNTTVYNSKNDPTKIIRESIRRKYDAQLVSQLP